MQSNPQTSIKTLVGLAAAAHVATVTPSTGQDVRGFQEAAIIVNAGTFVGAASLTLAVQVSSASDGTGDAFAAVYTFTAITTANDAGQHRARIKLSGLNRYMRIVATYSGNGTTEIAPCAVTIVLMGASESALCNDTYAGNVES